MPLADELRREFLVDRGEFLRIEAALGLHLVNCLKVVAVVAGDGPFEHSAGRAGDIAESMHGVARDEDQRVGADGRFVSGDGKFVGAIQDVEVFFPVVCICGGGPSPGLTSATTAENVPPVCSPPSMSFMSMPKGLMEAA